MRGPCFLSLPKFITYCSFVCLFSRAEDREPVIAPDVMSVKYCCSNHVSSATLSDGILHGVGTIVRR